MALSVKKGVITSPGATGDQATTGVGFEPKALILWTSYTTAAGQTGNQVIWCHGFGTEDGGSVQQGYAAKSSLETTSGAPSGACNNNAILRALIPSTTGTSADFAATLVSLDADGYTLNWSDLPATASIRIHYLALGGTDIAQARAFSVTGNNAATQDVTVVAGFGQPDLVLLAGGGGQALSAGVSGAYNIGLAAADQAVNDRCSWLWEEDGSAAAEIIGRQISELIVTRGTGASSSTVVDQAAISAFAAWPTDGFELSWSNVSTAGYVGLAIRGDLQVKVGTISSSTTGSGTTDFDAGFAPQAAIFWGLNMPSSASDIIADSTAVWGGFSIGAWDGSAEGHAGFTVDQGSDPIASGQYDSDTKAWRSMNAGATPAVAGDADCTASGNNVRLTWTDADTVVREINVIALAGVSGGTSETPTPGVAVTTGTTPTAIAGASAGLAPATGTTPTAVASASVGQAVAVGTAPTAATTATPSPAAAGTVGQTPTAQNSATPTPGVAAATGTGPIVQANTAPGTATGEGLAPTATTSATPTPGEATATGITPTGGRTDTPTPGVASATGTGPTASTTASQGIALGQGTQPSAATIAQPGSATATGSSPTASTTITPAAGVVVAQGFPPAEPGQNTPIPGVAVVVGNAPAATASITTTPGTATSQGSSPTGSTTQNTTAGQTLAVTFAPVCTTIATPTGTCTGLGITPNAQTTATPTVGQAAGQGIPPFDPGSIIPDPYPVRITLATAHRATRVAEHSTTTLTES